jgi:hypothetical protein
MQLKPAFQNYESLHRAYDSQIIEMAMQYGKYNFLSFFFVQVIFNKYFYMLKVFI